MSQSSLLRVLHVDAEQVMHRSVSGLLKPLGLVIDHAFSVEEAQGALSQARAAGTPYNLVITVGNLVGNLTGLDLLADVIANHSGVRVITFSTQPSSFWAGFENPPAGSPFMLQHVSKLDGDEMLLPAVKRALGLP